MTPSNDAFPEPCPPTPPIPEPSVLLPSSSLPLPTPPAAGSALGEAEPWVAVPPDRSPQPVRRFGTCTADLEALAAGLLDCGVTTVAMESTGVDWSPLCELLAARGLQVCLIDPRHAKRAPGRPQTDRLDCQGRHRLPAYGLLAAAFRPADQGCGLRRSLRHRQRLRTSGAHHIHHMHNALQQMHRTLSQVVSALTGGTGRAILHAIIAGERAPLTLATLRNPHGHHRADEIAKALQGTWRAEHLFARPPAVTLSHVYPQHLTVCAQRLQAHRGTCADTRDGQPLPPPPRRHQKANEPPFDARAPLYRLAGVALPTIKGSEEGTARRSLAELGTDRSRWPSVKHVCRWRGRSPPHKIAGGKGLSRRGRPGAQRVAVALRLAARTVQPARTALGAFYRRMRSRLGAPTALTATAPKLARLVYRLLRHGSASVQQGLEADESQYRARTGKALARHATAWGYPLVTLGTPEVPSRDAVATPTS